MGKGPGPRGAAGLTMVELLVAATVVLVAIVAIAAVFPVAMSTIDEGGDETVAMALAQSFGELIRNEAYDVVLAYNGFDSTRGNACNALPSASRPNCRRFRDAVQQTMPDNPAKRMLESGRVRVTVNSAIPPGGGERLATLTVIVSWRPRGEGWLAFTPTRTVTFVTRRTESL